MDDLKESAQTVDCQLAAQETMRLLLGNHV
jgi:hypothetical protein